MKFLIPTEPDDSHAINVKLALEEQGHHVQLLFTADQPTKLKNSVFMDHENHCWKSADTHDCITHHEYDVVWWRRARIPYVPKDSVHLADYKFVARENRLFFESITSIMALHARWINDKECAKRAMSKLLQLKVAMKCGMRIPMTLCSNDPYDIDTFLLAHEQEGVIYKPLCSDVWFEADGMRIAYTTKISSGDLPKQALLQFVPGIYQKEIKKSYELRVTYFNGYMVCVKLHSQEHPEGKVDWRAIPTQALRIEPYTLPTRLESQIIAFMQKMGLVFGALDFIVNEDDEIIFLEVNEQGQFLWIEELNPEIKMLDIFTHFLIAGGEFFNGCETKCVHRLEDYTHIAAEQEMMQRQRHINLNSAVLHNT